jgi:hypothetical protein
MDCPERLYGFVDARGQMRISPQFLEAHPFKNGHARVKVKDVGWEWIDTEGNVIRDESFVGEFELFDFEGGFGRFEMNDRSGFVNGMAIVTDPKSDKSGFIDATGEIVIPCQFDAAEDFDRVEPL